MRRVRIPLYSSKLHTTVLRGVGWRVMRGDERLSPVFHEYADAIRAKRALSVEDVSPMRGAEAS